MLAKVDTERFHIPVSETGHYRNGRNFQEDCTFPFPIPEQLRESELIQAVLELVTDKYLFYLTFAAPHFCEGVVHKINHTNDVVRAVMEIYEEHTGFSLEEAVALALIHDIARALQGAYFNKHSDKTTGIDHGELGAVIYHAHFTALHRLHLYNQKIKEGISQHNKLMPNREVYWVQLIRDADRLAIWRRIFDHAAAESYKNGDGSAISPEVLSAFAAGQLVNRKHVVSEADDLICTLAWMWDFKLEKARIQLAVDRWPERIVEYLAAQFAPPAAELAALQDGVRKWYRDFQLDQVFGQPYFAHQAN